MKKLNPLPVLAVAFALFLSFSAFSQGKCSVLQINNASTVHNAHNLNLWASAMELPFLLISVFFAFATAQALKGGKFGRGMNLLAWGFLVMAVGHLHMQVEHLYG